MKKAQSFIEYLMMFAVVTIIAITVWNIFCGPKTITKLSNMSKVTVRSDK